MHVVPLYSAAMASHKSVVNVAMPHWRGRQLPRNAMRLIVDRLASSSMLNLSWFSTAGTGVAAQRQAPDAGGYAHEQQGDGRRHVPQPPPFAVAIKLVQQHQRRIIVHERHRDHELL